MSPKAQKVLQRGVVIPACPLALTAGRKLDERRQRTLIRYYLAAGAGGLAVGVHTTQFAIREPKHGLFEPVLRLAMEEIKRAGDSVRSVAAGPRAVPGSQRVRKGERRGIDLGADSRSHPLRAGDGSRSAPVVSIAGVCGRTRQAVAEASLARDCGYEVALLSLGALREAREDELVAHCQEVARIIPVCGFYLQPAVGGRVLPYSFWRKFAGIENVVAVKIAPFNRYQTIDVVRAIAESGRDDIALYTGNDDNIILDLLTPYTFKVGGKTIERRIVGGLLGQWAVWTRRAVLLLEECHCIIQEGPQVSAMRLRQNIELTDANGAIFDAANGFAGCIPGIHEVLRRQGLLAGTWCLDPNEVLSKEQSKEIDRVLKAYPRLNDDEFVREHLDDWMR